MRSIIIVAGATASGKTDLAFQIAGKYPSVIINADSMQVYKEIPILSAQPPQEYKDKIPHYLYGTKSIAENYSVGMWLDEVKDLIQTAHKKNLLPIIVGGTGLYLKSLIFGLSKMPTISNEVREDTRNLLAEIGNHAFHNLLNEKDPQAAKKIQVNDRQRMARAYEVIEQTGKSLLKWQEVGMESNYNNDQFIIFRTDIDRKMLYERINERFLLMIEEGAIDEARILCDYINDHNLPALKVLGGKELISYFEKQNALSNAINSAQINTRQYAKRQLTWFRHQFNPLEVTSYVPGSGLESILNVINKKLT